MYRIIAILCLILCAPVAMAHSPLKSSMPAAGATYAAVPTELTMVFKGSFRPTRITAMHDDDTPLDIDLSHITGFGTEFVLQLPDQGPGVYVIEWRGLSEDGHGLNGSFEFNVE